MHRKRNQFLTASAIATGRIYRFLSPVQALKFIHLKDLFRFCKPAWMDYSQWFETEEGKKQIDGPSAT